ncbi:molybdopterin molybdotransferase MoeA [Fusibacter ferrireducens]|uniref:Molybdopterin molybdenumtransferase n=1 Tax=Fusibacter ferrireducens TaxID=2785058 RepID=A0ABR9ZS18_9FIRM|nr:gephyrin-like molybdotransferase Glp [Fusibacter ferrireducens]MBF4692913.1 molybdopterin molybdotransferase MoeA [Fusibacter ferrireducens]
MNFFKIRSLSEARAIIHDEVSRLKLEVERISIGACNGFIACENVYSEVDIPSFDRSTVDGYAVKIDDVMGATESIPAMLKLKGDSVMGEVMSETLQKGEAIYVPTGGMLPHGSDGVVMIEYSEQMSSDLILIRQPIAFGENIIYHGDDLKKEQLIIEAGKRINAYDMGLLAGAGINAINVYKKIKVAILSTGDEVVDCHLPIKMGQIRDINGYALMGLVSELGGEVVHKAIIRDDMNALKASVAESLEKADLVLLSGGSSVGTRDFTHQVIESFADGEILIHGISIKPGKPTIVGRAHNKLIFGLPGHPTASALVFEILVRPYMESVSNLKMKSIKVNAQITESIHSASGKDTFIMVNLAYEDNVLRAKPILGKSGLISLMTKASGYIHIESDQEGLYKGQDVNVYLFKRGEL